MKNNATSNKWFALTIVLTAPLLYVIDIFIINMAIPGIQQGVHATNGEMQLVIAGYLLGSASLLIIGGRAGDYLGKKKVFLWGMMLFTLSSCCCGLSQTAMQLNIMRFFQGVSSALMVPQSIAYIQVLFTDPKERAKAIGWYGATLSIAAIIGQILGGWLVDTHLVVAGWRLIFFINLPVGIAATWAIARFLPETDKITTGNFDYTGAGILTTGLICLIYPLTKGRELGWPAWSIWLILLSLLLFTYLCIDQKKKKKHLKIPLLDISLFTVKEFNLGLLAVLFHFMMHTAYLLMIAVYLQDGLHLSALECGTYFLLHAVLFMITSMLAGRLIPRHGKRVLLAGIMIILLSFLLQVKIYQPQMQRWWPIALIGLYGLGNGMVLPSLLTIVLRSIPAKLAGTASGVFSTFQQTASALGICIIGGVFYHVIDIHPHPDYLIAFKSGMAADIICLIMVAIILWLLPVPVSNDSAEPESITME